MVDNGPGKIVDLRTARGVRRDVAAVARDRFAAARRATDLPPAAFADVLVEALGWSVTPEAISAWESTSVPPGDVLLAAEQIAGQPAVIGAPAGDRMRLLDTYSDVQGALTRVVEDAAEVIAVTGSRSRDPDYLARIEAAITSRDLLHYRVLYGPPRHGALKNHLLRLIDLHRPAGRVNIGAFWDLHVDGERFIFASEQTAVVVLPSVTSLLNFDTALVIDDPALAGAYVTHVRQAFLASQELTTRAMIEALEVLR
jgi:hypothetical protein